MDFYQLLGKAEETHQKISSKPSNFKSTKVKRMLTKTKSANHSVISEAVNERDTADTLAGRNQCDEDDYGYF